MASTFTPNIQWEEPARGDDVGTWDTPVNANGTLIDLVTGAIATIGLNNSNVVLSAAQFRSKQITFNSTLTGSVTITFPTSFTKSYEIQHLCTGSSAFTITLATTVGGQAVAVPPGETIDCFNDGSNLKFKNLGRVGSYWDYGGSSVPNWVSGCSVPPYLNCDGSAVSSATYPVLFGIMPTLPNSKGRARFALDQGAGLISTAVFSSSAVGAVGGLQTTTLSSQHLPKLVEPSSGHFHSYTAPQTIFAGGAGGAASPSAVGANTGAATTGITYGSSSQIAVPTIPPAYIGGLTLIRAG